jgi:hypothetical protein
LISKKKFSSVKRKITFLREIMARVIFLLTEENFFLEINQSETRIACGGHVC